MATILQPDAALLVLAAPVVCLGLIGLYLRWCTRQIYRRIGTYSIGETTFDLQLQYPGLNFPGPNVLEPVIAAQPADLQAAIAAHRGSLRRWRRVTLSYLGCLLTLGLVFSVVRQLGS